MDKYKIANTDNIDNEEINKKFKFSDRVVIDRDYKVTLEKVLFEDNTKEYANKYYMILLTSELEIDNGEQSSMMYYSHKELRDRDFEILKSKVGRKEIELLKLINLIKKKSEIVKLVDIIFHHQK